ncbi:olfactory receptor 14I1-like [Tiliqua scincoides]|uniref:olfactory receptor 14I1-like n=1 Tax=Tiliqua scincoides TaxID=71010 RepID=UPI003461E9DC
MEDIRGICKPPGDGKRTALPLRIPQMEHKMSNKTSVLEFLLLQFSDLREFQILHFVAFLLLYLGIVSGNLLIIAVIAFDRHLHSPMYFFLMNLAVQDIGHVSVFIPKSMANSLMNTRHISYSGCVAQVLFFIFFLSSDFAILTVMAYDRYVAICNPLEYEMIMNRGACRQIIAIVWMTVFLYSVLHTCGTFASPFCSNIVNQFFCEVPQLLKLTCSDLYLVEMGILVLSAVICSGCLIFIAVTYGQIFSAVRKISSATGRRKALSTCLPHLIVVSTFLCTSSFAYLTSPFNKTSHLDIAVTLIYSVFPPMLNPVIYSLRNKEIKNALQRLLGLTKKI